MNVAYLFKALKYCGVLVQIVSAIISNNRNGKLLKESIPEFHIS
jgi:hypothetical protein